MGSKLASCMPGLSLTREQLQLIPDRAHELLALLDIGRGLHTFRGEPVDHAEDASTLHGIGTGADDMADLGAGLQSGAGHLRHESCSLVSLPP